MARIRKGEKQNTQSTKAAWRVGGYIRLSREDGEDESLSVTNQRKIIDEYFAERLEADAILIDYYADDGITGTDYDRPEFQRLMRDIESGAINCVVCKTLSRAFRNYSDQGFFLENFFPKHGTRFISIGGPDIDTFLDPSVISGLEVPITGLMNDRFAGKTSEDIRRTFNNKRKRGEFIGAFAPYGYEKDPNDKNRLIIDHEAAEIVRDLFALFVDEGYSLRGIAMQLNERGIPNPSKYKKSKGLNFHNPQSHVNDGLWSGTVIRRMLQNKLYIGHMVQGRQKIVSYKIHDRVSVPEENWFIKENTHEPIVSDALFEKAQDLLTRDARTSNHEKRVHLFSGFIRCADCKKSLVRHPSKGIVYYVCRTYSEKHRERCTKHTIREDVLYRLVFEAVRMQMHTLEPIGEASHSLDANEKPRRLAAMVEKRKNELVRVRNAATSLYLDAKNGDISQDDYVYMKESFDKQISALSRAIANIEGEQIQCEQDIKPHNAAASAIFTGGAIEKLDRCALISLIDMVCVHENKRITVLFKIRNPFAHVR